MASIESHPLHPGNAVPFFISAGVLKEPWQLEPFLHAEDPAKLPALTLGSFVIPRWSGNASPEHPVDFVYYQDLGMAGNARGLPSNGIEGMRSLEPSMRLLSDIGVKTIISVTNLPHEKALDVIPYMVEEAAELKPTAIEVNLSCPNGLKADGSLHAPLCNDTDASGEVMEASRNRVGPNVCLGGKDSPHVTSLEDKVNERAVSDLIIVLNPLIDFITGVNTIGNQPFPEITSTGGRGGLSGPAEASIAHSWLRIASIHTAAHVAILSCGGVDTVNLPAELPMRQKLGALRIGGAQEFYRAEQPYQVVERWALQSGL